MKKIVIISFFTLFSISAFCQGYPKTNKADTLTGAFINVQTNHETFGVPIDTFLNNTIDASSTLDFASTAIDTFSTLTITATGAADGDIVALGVPDAAATVGGTFFAWVSSANTVAIRFANNDNVALDPASGTFKIRVYK